jgi:hypothetical protein
MAVTYVTSMFQDSWNRLYFLSVISLALP